MIHEIPSQVWPLTSESCAALSMHCVGSARVACTGLSRGILLNIIEGVNKSNIEPPGCSTARSERYGFEVAVLAVLVVGGGD